MELMEFMELKKLIGAVAILSITLLAVPGASAQENQENIQRKLRNPRTAPERRRHSREAGEHDPVLRRIHRVSKSGLREPVGHGSETSP